MSKKSVAQPREADRTKIPVAVRHQLLLEAGYKCGNLACRNVVTLDLHHIQYVSDGGGDDPANLLALCPYCHAMHHTGQIPVEAVRTWKGLLLALNQAFDRRAVDLLLYLRQTQGADIWYSGDGLLQFAPLVAAGLVAFRTEPMYASTPPGNFQWGSIPVHHQGTRYQIGLQIFIELTAKGRLMVDAWLAGDPAQFLEAIRPAPVANSGTARSTGTDNGRTPAGAGR
jgi:hypothetical protein